MARSIEQIYQSILDAKAADAELDGLTSTSATAVWRLWAYVTAVAMWTHEKLWDSHKAEVSAIIVADKPHSLRWYVYMSKRYQHGDSLPVDSDTYATIEPSLQVVTQAACTENAGHVRLKAAKGAGPLEALDSAELTGLTAYIARIKDAGVRIAVTSGAADDLRLELALKYDPLVLDATGARLDGTSATPVRDSIAAFLVVLPFNGLMILNRLLAAILAVEGVVDATITSASARYGALDYSGFGSEYLPDAGYLAHDEDYFDANVVYTAHEAV